MIDIEKLYDMIALSSFESGRGRASMNICGYYRSDYMARELIRAFFTGTAGIILLAALLFAGHAEALFAYLERADLVKTLALAALLALLAMVCILTLAFVAAYRRYSRAEEEMRAYDRRMRELMKLSGAGDPGAEEDV